MNFLYCADGTSYNALLAGGRVIGTPSQQAGRAAQSLEQIGTSHEDHGTAPPGTRVLTSRVKPERTEEKVGGAEAVVAGYEPDGQCLELQVCNTQEYVYVGLL